MYPATHLNGALQLVGQSCRNPRQGLLHLLSHSLPPGLDAAPVDDLFWLDIFLMRQED